MARGGRREGAGRPVGTLRPSGKKPRNLRMTDKEYKAVKTLLAQLRKNSDNVKT